MLQLLGCLLVLVYVILPIIYRYSMSLQVRLLFVPYVPWTRLNLIPEENDLPSTRNFNIKTEDGVTLGAWHVLPDALISGNEVAGEHYEKLLSNGSPIMLYLHGNSNTRAQDHRVNLYKVLRKLNYHIITFDYRGYADSDKVHLSEEGVVTDMLSVYQWLKSRSADSPVIIWGHSLGTGVGTRGTAELSKRGSAPSALILESPFNNLSDEVRSHPLTWVYRILPWFDALFITPMLNNGISFKNDEHISGISCPVLILHAKDDKIVPYHLGKKLYDSAVRSQRNVWFESFSENLGYGHRFICKDPGLPQIIQNFVEKSLSKPVQIAS